MLASTWVVAVALLVLTAAPASASRQVDLPLRAVTGDQPRITDELGRQVLLRGVNVVQLGDYYQADPDSPPTFPLTEADFARIASMGFDVVRLVLHWSALQPQPGGIDDAELDRIAQALDWARAHDVYVVLDLHQDAWSKHLFTPPDETCPPGFSPSIGWDGAPPWATYTDGQSTCQVGTREFSPAVAHAFESFWVDRAGPDGTGIQTHFMQVWQALAARFGADPVVAGYDLFNEPHPGYSAGATDTALLAAFYRRTIEAIRDSEQAAGAPPKPVFFEPSVLWSGFGAGPIPPPGFTDDDGIVFAPHLYAGSFTLTPGFGVDEGFEAAATAASTYGATFWSGEWGWFGNPETDAAKVARYAQLEDAHAVGGAWWSWRQACGDPHNHRDGDGEPVPLSPSLVRYSCPGDVELGIPDEFATILSRPYPRAAPGVITALTSNPQASTLHLEASAGDASGQAAELWVPDRGRGAPRVTGTGMVGTPRLRPVAGGWRVSVAVEGNYVIDVEPARMPDTPPNAAPRPVSPTTAPPNLATTGGGMPSAVAVVLAAIALVLSRKQASDGNASSWPRSTVPGDGVAEEPR